MAIILTITVVAIASSAQTVVEEGVPVPLSQTSCWECHEVWDPPMRAMIHVVPPDRMVVAPGQAFDYTIEVQNAWMAQLSEFEATLDLTGAPNLTFPPAAPPLLDQVQTGAIPLDPVVIRERRAAVTHYLPPQASDVTFTLSPDNTDPTLGPDLVLAIYPPGTDRAAGDPPLAIVDNAGNGAAETWRLNDPVQLRKLGSGEWNLEARFFPSDPQTQIPRPGIQGNIGFSVVMDAYFNATTERQQTLKLPDVVEVSQGLILSWRLQAQKVPAAEEVVLYTLNFTSYYAHRDSRNPNEGWHLREGEIRLSPFGQQLVLEAPVEGGGRFVAPEFVDPGVSMARLSEAIGYVAAFLLLVSMWSGGVLGKGSRRRMNRIFRSARRRVAFHNFLSYGILATAIIHLVLFILETSYHWSLGLIWGGAATLGLLALGVTGALQVPLIRRWGFSVWRHVHLWTAVATVVLSLVHLLLDGANFGNVQEAVGWEDPLVQALS